MSLEQSQKTKLVHVTTVPWSLYFVRGQVQDMERRGFEVTIISSPEPALKKFGEEQRVRVRGVWIRRAISPLNDLKSIFHMCAALWELRPQIVHTHSPKGGLIGMISAALMGTPVRIYHIRGLPYMTATGWKRRLVRWSERLSCRLAHEVFCVSHSIKSFAVEDGLAPASKIKVFLGGSGNGVDADRRFNRSRWPLSSRETLRNELGISPNEAVIGFVGRAAHDKGIADLVSAWQDIREAFPSVRLMLVGGLDSRDPVSEETQRLLTQDPRVVLVGDVPDSAPYYSLCDLIVLPSYREGFPNVLLEAGAMELPVVATDIPGCTDAVLEGTTGVLVPPGNPGSLRTAIERYLADPSLRQQHGQAGRRRVLREFRQEAIWEAIYQEYCRLLQIKGLPLPQSSPESSASQ